MEKNDITTKVLIGLVSVMLVAVIVVTEMDRAVVEDVAANKKRSNNRHPYQSSMKQKPKEDEEYVDNQKDGECQSEERKPRHNVWRDECQCHTQP